MTTAANQQELNEQVKTLATHVVNNLPTRDHVDRRFDSLADRITRVDAAVAEVNSKVAASAVQMVDVKTDITRRMDRLETLMAEILNRLPPPPETP